MAHTGDRQRRLKILIVAPAWVGDMVMAHCLVRVLSARYPGADIQMLAPPATEPLARRMPGVSRTLTLDVAHGELALGRRRRLGLSLRAEHFNRAIVLPNSFKSALVPLWAGIPRRTGWHGESRFGVLNDRRVLEKNHFPLMIERFMALALEDGVLLDKPYPHPVLEADSRNAERLRLEHGLGAAGITVMCPGAEFGPAKRWPAEHFATVARHLTAAGGEVWLVGATADNAACAEIASLVPTGLINLAGKTALLDAVDLISLADQVICNDSGLMHVACALERRVFAVYGSTSPEFTPPLADDATIVRLGLECSPCFQRECPLGHLDCLRQLLPEQVIEQLPLPAAR